MGHPLKTQEGTPCLVIPPSDSGEPQERLPGRTPAGGGPDGRLVSSGAPALLLHCLVLSFQNPGLLVPNPYPPPCWRNVQNITNTPVLLPQLSHRWRGEPATAIWPPVLYLPASLSDLETVVTRPLSSALGVLNTSRSRRQVGGWEESYEGCHIPVCHVHFSFTTTPGGALPLFWTGD